MQVVSRRLVVIEVRKIARVMIHAETIAIATAECQCMISNAESGDENNRIVKGHARAIGNQRYAEDSNIHRAPRGRKQHRQHVYVALELQVGHYFQFVNVDQNFFCETFAAAVTLRRMDGWTVM